MKTDRDKDGIVLYSKESYGVIFFDCCPHCGDTYIISDYSTVSEDTESGDDVIYHRYENICNNCSAKYIIYTKR